MTQPDTTYTNAAGGKQSVIPWKMSLWPNNLLREALRFNDECFFAFKELLATRELLMLRTLVESNRSKEVIWDSTYTLIDETLQMGAEKYGRFNWHRIPSHEHLDHALLHLFNLGGLAPCDPREELAHFLTRITFYWDMLDIEAELAGREANF